ncbi:bifunctional phosphoribosyl-AMP cyclohydrolase/phosphoribosyl-ATP diphosphatase HisIE [Alicyclobacillus dauci]|uniref:Histidine biosynthesis bifunctional protein HisIE n=1 Tax=Alicyclobacillus dauci TaxID=1475485 RepID=A0ABY6Z0Z6_9BACL|nr:bifunctional phosphoribosyl-AMP cyclohydrolase/phosphoribosyl-ATP diphosphatase HisIE [Alicyclobacillus dauci]WAH35906.1 bifunctional phosphoribosyl-AMP cyclohydrolase/phosphoribosyl-ATP diphosphatase HisIE [Alicyclobacillus dauci]
MDIPMTKETVDLSLVRYDSTTGLVPVVVQDAETGQVLMVAYANREALKRTLATQQAWFWSRSRQSYWHKGATSGNVQHIVDVRMDCDGDTVLYLVRPDGPACHTGETSCFYRSVSHNETEPVAVDVHSEGNAALESAREAGDRTRITTLHEVGERSAEDDSSRLLESADFETLVRLWQVIDSRFRERPEGSYTTYLFAHGTEKIGKKVGEEAVEVALASLRSELTGEPGTVASESADLLYHLLALWRAVGVQPQDVLQALADRS